MINLILGQPGGGKSFEAVAYHIIPAITAGRRVITNLSLNVEVFDQYWPGAAALIEKRDVVVSDGKTIRPFSQVDHYSDPWRDEKTGAGALYVIDECHLALPRIGTPVAVEEWYSLHRHEGADVLLITQSYGKINPAIRDLVQVVYRCKKATAFGSSDRYIRKVQDGLRGEVVNTSIRSYESKYFPLYKSHTLTNAAVQELAANDIIPIWKRWPFKGALICVFIVVGLSFYNTHRAKTVKPSSSREPVAHSESSASTNIPQEKPQIVQQVAAPLPEKKLHPYDGYTFHLVGLLKGKRYNDQGVEEDYLGGYFSIAQEGQNVRTVSFQDLREAGYHILYVSPTVVNVDYKGYDLGSVISDIPRITLQPAGPSISAAH